MLRDVLDDGGTFVVETAVFADANRDALLYCPVVEENPYDETCPTLCNVKGLEDSLRSLGLQPVERELQCAFEPSPDEGAKTIDRVVVACRKDRSGVKPKVASYWDGTHDLHSSGAQSLD